VVHEENLLRLRWLTIQTVRLTFFMRFILYPEGLEPALRSAHWNRVPYWLWSFLAIGFCASLYGFLKWVPWESALTPQDALRESPDLAAQINPAWRAVTIQHGHVYEWPQGTVAQNPAGYHFASFFFVVCATLTIGLAFAVIVKASDYKASRLD
jgi:hypothetical protein